ncbi:MFS transporter [Pseudonocardia kujensis]|uniref:MFS transporter n=1 Tax=Pseudonocardia kujensis TaxID=1128675 RepID=UPI001E3E8B3C|nr:MFS transporter [Pseudonocardia kujensis]MCE0767479.1 MFS transporter [Pseudonocardia kujensis]
MTTPDRARTRAVAAMTFATGVIIANNYYAQPLEAALSAHFAVPSSAIGAVLTLIQLSYALGLATLVPLGDLLERRRLVVTMLSVTVLGLVVVALSPTLPVLAAAAGFVGLTTVAAQILVPFSASIAPEGEQGRVVSTVMSGLLIGILVSRVVAGLVAEVVGWRGVFALGAALTAVAVLALWRTLPVVAPSTSLPYPRLLLSVVRLIRDEPVLRFRMALGASGYASFGALWTSVGFLLAAPPYRLSEATIGLFALFGVAGAVAARFAGRLADRGHSFGATGAFLGLVALSWIPLGLGAFSLVALAIGLVVFDLGVQGSHISNQNTIYALQPQARSRLNTAYMTSYFLGGAAGSGLSSALYATHGWAGVSIAGAAFPTAGFLLWLVVAVRRRRTSGTNSRIRPRSRNPSAA